MRDGRDTFALDDAGYALTVHRTLGRGDSDVEKYAGAFCRWRFESIPMNTLYGLLGIPPDADNETLEKAFREAQSDHPDTLTTRHFVAIQADCRRQCPSARCEAAGDLRLVAGAAITAQA